MKILMVNKFLYSKGGSESYVLGLSEYLINHGHCVQFFGMEDEKNIVGNNIDSYVSNFDFKNITIQKLFYPLKIIYSIEAKKKLGKLIEYFNPDIIHLNNFNFQITPSILYEIKKKNIPVVMTLHDFQIVCPNHMLYLENKNKVCEACKGKKYRNCVSNRCLHNSITKSIIATIESYLYHRLHVYEKYIDYYISPSEFLKNKFIEFGVNGDNIYILHNFIPNGELMNTIKKNYVLYFGRLSIQKGIKTLIETCKKLNDIQFIIAGDGKFKDEIQGIKNINYVGFKNGDDLRILISEALFSILPSECYDNCPMSVLESQMLGTPVIGANIGGIPELIQDKKDGLLFEPGNIEDLTNKIKFLYSNRNILQQFSNKCIKKINKFSIDNYYKKLINIYNLALNYHH